MVCRVALVLLAMPALCACFSVGVGTLPGGSVRRAGLASGAAAWQLRRPHTARTPLLASADDDAARAAAKDEALRRLAGTDAPKSAPKKVEQKEPPLPEWAFFVLPIFGAASAFAFQVRNLLVCVCRCVSVHARRGERLVTHA